MGKNSRKRESGVEVVAKVQSGRTAREARRGEMAEKYGLQVKTVYNWLASTARSTGVNINEISRLKRENELLKSIIGKFVYEEELKKSADLTYKAQLAPRGNKSALAKEHGILASPSPKSSPWRNGSQESFFGRFKVEFGDPARFSSLPELMEAIYCYIGYYNTERIHSAHRAPPAIA